MRMLIRISIYLMLLAAGIPWYWPDDDRSILFGMPAWVIAAIAVGICVALYTAWCLSQDIRKNAQ